MNNKKARPISIYIINNILRKIHFFCSKHTNGRPIQGNAIYPSPKRILDRSLHNDLNGNAKSEPEVRVRFAPSPTGYLHIGGARTALHNFLFAKSSRGKFIIRIEDTDFTRTIPGSVEQIEQDLCWLSIIPDESPIKGGCYAPYKQSERLNIYKEKVEILLQNGFAYKCFCSPERLKAIAKTYSSYDNHCKTLNKDQIQNLTSKNAPFCIRFKLHNENYALNDLVFGKRSFAVSGTEGDFIIVKTNGLPTYHLANVIDDHMMGITHVLRGEDWLGSTAKHLQLYKSFEWEPPQFGHLPQLLNIDGTKLSKRQQDTHIRDLRDRGFSPEAVLNFIKFSGGGFQDVDHSALCQMPDLIQKFRLDRIKHVSTTVDMEKLKMFSRLHLQSRLSTEEGMCSEIANLKNELVAKYKLGVDTDLSDTFLREVLLWGQTRVHKTNDFMTTEYEYLWKHPCGYTKEELVKLKLNAELVLGEVSTAVQTMEPNDYNAANISLLIKSIQKNYSIKTLAIMKLLRIVICGSEVGPPVAEIYSLLGKKVSLHRVKQAQLVMS